MRVPFLIRWGCLECLAFPKGLTSWEPQHVRIKSAFNMPCLRILFLKSISEHSLAVPSGPETAHTGHDTALVLLPTAQSYREWERFCCSVELRNHTLSSESYLFSWRILQCSPSACSREQLPLINVFTGLNETEVIWGFFFKSRTSLWF